MKITNKHNLPQALINFVNTQQDDHAYKPKRYSVTEILNPVRLIMLERRHDDEIEQDVSNMVNLIRGQAVHYIAESHDTSGNSEIKLEQPIRDGYVLSGRFDLYNEADFAIEDYKDTSTWKIIFNDFEEWRLQGLMYAWMLRKQGKLVFKIRFHALLKDWTARELRLAQLKNSFYPERSIWTWEMDVTTSDIQEIENYINDKFDEIIAQEQLPDEELKLCSEKERWYSGDKYAVMKHGRASAVRVLDTEQEANDYMKNQSGDYIVKRPGENRRCQDYCNAAPFCPFYKKEVVNIG